MTKDINRLQATEMKFLIAVLGKVRRLNLKMKIQNREPVRAQRESFVGKDEITVFWTREMNR